MPPLLHDPYQAPRLPVGARTLCLLRDCEVVITSWSDAPISWLGCPARSRLEDRENGSVLAESSLMSNRRCSCVPWADRMPLLEKDFPYRHPNSAWQRKGR